VNSPLERLSFKELPGDAIPLEGVLLVKYISEDGLIHYAEMCTPTLHPIEALGMVKTAEDTLRSRLMRGTREQED